MDPAVLAARVLLAAVFAVAGATKLRDRRGTAEALAEFGLSRGAALPAAHVLPVAELAVAAALLVNPLAPAAGLAAVLLLAIFTAGIGNALRQGRAPDCGCFGNLSARPVSGWTVARNAALLAVAVSVAVRGSDASFAPAVAGGAAIALAVAAAAAAASGRTAGVGGVAVGTSMLLGLEPGAPAPAFRLKSTAGQTRSLASFCERGLPVVVILLDSGCGSCHELHPHLRRWQRGLWDSLSIVVIMRGDEAAATALADSHGVADVLVDHGAEPVSAAFRIRSAPSAVLITSDGKIGSRPVRGADAIEELVRQTVHRSENAQAWKHPSPIA